jgi:hypothetical protein
MGIVVWSKLLSTLKGVASPALKELMLVSLMVGGTDVRLVTWGWASTARCFSFRARIDASSSKVPSSSFGCWRLFLLKARARLNIPVCPHEQK